MAGGLFDELLTMELKKEDKKHIEEEIRKLTLRINVEASEYANLYRIEYLTQLRNKIDAELESIGYMNDRVIEIANTPTL